MGRKWLSDYQTLGFQSSIEPADANNTQQPGNYCYYDGGNDSESGLGVQEPPRKNSHDPRPNCRKGEVNGNLYKLENELL